MSNKHHISSFDPVLIRQALWYSLKKLSPAHQIKNPVMFIVLLVNIMTTGLCVVSLFGYGDRDPAFTCSVAAWLWLTLLFANFSEALAEGRGKAQAASLRHYRKDTLAKKMKTPQYGSAYTAISSKDLKKDDVVLVEAGDMVPIDGEVIEGVATLNESAITGESAPVIREEGGDRSTVTGGTTVLSDWLIIRVTATPGETFLDRMIQMVEGAKRKKTPNEIALSILLVGLALIFLLATATLLPFSIYSVVTSGSGTVVSVTVLAALLVCLIPTTIGGLLPAIGIAGIDRMIQANVVATSGRAVEAAGDIDILLLDKTGTITLGNREAVAFIAAEGYTEQQLAETALLASLSDDTPEGRSIVALAKERYSIPERHPDASGKFIAFTAQTRMSGVDVPGKVIRKGAYEAVRNHVLSLNGLFPEEMKAVAMRIAKSGGTPLAVSENERLLGLVHLKDIVKGGIKERFSELRSMGIKTIMVTGDNPLTAGAIAAEAGVDDFLAEATPDTKLKLIREKQEQGHVVAMTGDGTNDAPALAQADVAVVMNSGTQAAKEAGNMIDLDSNPTKLIEVVKIGKQLLMTRGSLTTFSIANDISKYFAIIPAAFIGTYPVLAKLNIMHLTTPQSAVLSTVIFNALIIVLLIPFAIKGVPYKTAPATRLLRDNIFVYGLGGIIAPFLGIKLIDMALVALNFVR